MEDENTPESEKYWPYGTPCPRRLIDGFKALEAVKEIIEKLDLSKLTVTDLKTTNPTIHLSDLKDTVARYSLPVKISAVIVEEVRK